MSDTEDPLELKQLALNYDYLMYKINDYVQNLSDQTFEAVTAKETMIKRQYLGDQLRLDEELRRLDQLLADCRQLEQEFAKLDQLYFFVEDFKKRLVVLESEFDGL